MPNEPSMEEILSSIKRIIADDERAPPRAPRRGAPANAAVAAAVPEIADSPADDQVLELTEALPEEPARLEADMPASPKTEAPKIEAPRAEARPAKADSRPARAETRGEPRRPRESAPEPTAKEANVLSDMSARAARDSLDHLSRLLVRSEDGQSNTLEGLVRELLRPMLKEWLDARLPELVETMVKREIDRITGRV